MVVDGMDIVDAFAQVGEMSQPRLWQDGDRYIASLDLKPTMIEHARVD